MNDSQRRGTTQEDADTSEVRGKLRFARESYLEVLDATKHQDDKIGRYLTALAFLTTGAITLLFRGDLLAVRFRFAGEDLPMAGNYPLVAWLTALFFVCILGSVVLLLLSLSSPLRIPGMKTEWGPKLGKSRLFFTYIGSQRVDEWQSQWSKPTSQAIEKELLEQYVLETHNLSERARTKYQHTNEASTLFVLALYFLAFAVMLSIKAAIDVRPLSGDFHPPVTYGVRTSAALGLVASAYSIVQIYARYAHDRRSFDLVYKAALHGVDSKAARTLQAARSIRWLMVTIPVFVFAHALPWDNVTSRRLGFLVAILAVVFSFALTFSRWANASTPSKGWRILAYGVLPIALSAACLAVGGVAQLFVVVLPGVTFSLWSLAEIVKRDRDLLATKRKQGLRDREKIQEAQKAGAPAPTASPDKV